MLTREELPECPVATTVQLIGNKWKMLIIRNLMFGGTQRFTDFIKSVPGISKKVLTDNLRALENDGARRTGGVRRGAAARGVFSFPSSERRSVPSGTRWRRGGTITKTV